MDCKDKCELLQNRKPCDSFDATKCIPEMNKEVQESISRVGGKIMELCSKVNPDPTNFEESPKNQLAMTPLELKLWREMSKEDKEAYLRKNYPSDYR